MNSAFVSSAVLTLHACSIHEGGELGYALAVAYGSVMDNPDLISVAIIGDGESETGPTATAFVEDRLFSFAVLYSRDGVWCSGGMLTNSSTRLRVAPSFPSCMSTGSKSVTVRSLERWTTRRL
jgi:XFP N-terminal domain